MHIQGDSIVKDFLEESVNYQTGDVMLLYAVVFLVLAVLCVIQYQMARPEGQSPVRDRPAVIPGGRYE